MVHDFILLAFALTIGFVSAGVAASFYKLVTSQTARFGPVTEGSLAWLSAFLFGILAGPVIIVQTARERVRDGSVPPSMLAAGVVIAALWSGCLGVVLLELAINVRNSLA